MARRLSLLGGLIALVLLAGCGGGGSDSPALTACADLITVTLPNAKVTSATAVPAGSFMPGDGTTVANMPAMCRVVGIATPTSDSKIGFEVWLPQADQWNGKYAQVGTQGYAGTYQYGPMAVVFKRGYAVASTDTGHQQNILDLVDWALGHPERIIDFGYRAHRETVAKAKSIIHANLGRLPAKSYFLGGSNGGREAPMAAQRYPEEFDGYIAEGPAITWTHLSASWLNTEQALRSDPASTIAAAKQPAIQAAALAQCDALDGIADGIVNDPRACKFDPSVLQCTGAESDACLTVPQITALKRVLDGPRNPRTGQRVYGGFEPGGSASFSWTQFIFGPALLPILPVGFNGNLANAFYANMVFDVGNANFDFKSINFDADVTTSDTKSVGTETLAAVINGDSTDYSRMKAKGAKMLMAAGWDDPVVPARSIIEYYENVVAAHTLGSDLAGTQTSFRLFLVPGLNHLTGGAGPTAFGSIFGQPGIAADAQHDILSALEAWVEQGVAPDTIVAASYVNNDPAAAVARTRPLCPYPKLAHWSGNGSSDDAKNFACVDGPRGAYLN